MAIAIAIAVTLGRESTAADMIADPALCAAAVAMLQQQYRAGAYPKPDPAEVALRKRRLEALEGAGPDIERLVTEFNSGVSRLKRARIARLAQVRGLLTERFFIELGEYLIREMNGGDSIRGLGSYAAFVGGGEWQTVQMVIRAGAWSVSGRWNAEVSACLVFEGPGSGWVEGCASLGLKDWVQAARSGRPLRRITAFELWDRARAAIPELTREYTQEMDFIADGLEKAMLWCPNYTLMSRVGEPGDARVTDVRGAPSLGGTPPGRAPVDASEILIGI